MGIYIKSDRGIDRMIPRLIMVHDELTLTDDCVTSLDNTIERKIYTGYLGYELQDTSYTTVSFPSEWKDFSFVWMDLQNSYVTDGYLTYTIPYYDGKDYISGCIIKNSSSIKLTHTVGWGGYAVYLTLRMC